MEFDLDYETFKYISEEAKSYVFLDKLLENNNMTFEEALRKTCEHKKNFYDLLKKYGICPHNKVSIYTDLMNLLKESVNTDLQYIYCAVITDTGLLIDINSERTDEQDIRCMIKQKETIDELMEFLHNQSVMKKRLENILYILTKTYRTVSEYENKDEYDDIMYIASQYDFLVKEKDDDIYSENMRELLYQVNSRPEIQSLKPYIISAVLSRKTGLMTKRKHYIPNLKNILQYQEYNIYKDNGKNFNYYQTCLELYENLRRYYEDSPEVDIEFSDYCFANLSLLSEWYYQNCEPNEDIPMNLVRKIMTSMSLTSSTFMGCDDYNSLDKSELEICYNAEYKLWEQILDMTEYLIL